MTTAIENKTILITGANRGIGKAIAETFLNKGAAKVYAAVRDPKSAQPLIDTYGDRVVALQLDVADTESVNKAAEVSTDVDIVINNAGVLRNSSPLDLNAFESFEFEQNVNVYGLIRVAQAFAPILKANGGGAFAQLNSVASVKNFAAFATYSASKAASYSITQGLRDVLAEQGTQVISVHPGPIATDMAKDAGIELEADPPQVVAEGILEALQSGAFHVFPDQMAKQIEGAYASFSENIVEANLMEA